MTTRDTAVATEALASSPWQRETTARVAATDNVFPWECPKTVSEFSAGRLESLSYATKGLLDQTRASIDEIYRVFHVPVPVSVSGFSCLVSVCILECHSYSCGR